VVGGEKSKSGPEIKRVWMTFLYKEKFGIFSDEFKLIPAPNFMLRRNAILDAISDLKPGKLIEIGFGTGVCTYEFYRRGYECTGYELEHKSIEFANALFNTTKEKIIDFRGEIFEKDYGSYDYLAVLEVLEHIINDKEALESWSKLLKSDGRIIVSVPAKMKKYSYVDKVAGHIRRYERDELVKLLESSGFKIETLFCYGYPFSNIFIPLSNLLYRRMQYNKYFKHMNDEEKTRISGYLRLDDFRFRKVFPYNLIYLFSVIQRLFYKTDLSLGYVVVAQKKH
jgi:2-polyprenyl-3-methyl-5-hydroxy-6-metoxy-1,4-benzoquinol methylase